MVSKVALHNSFELAKSKVPPLFLLLSNNLNPLPSSIFLATLSLAFTGTSPPSVFLYFKAWQEVRISRNVKKTRILKKCETSIDCKVSENKGTLVIQLTKSILKKAAAYEKEYRSKNKKNTNIVNLITKKKVINLS